MVFMKHCRSEVGGSDALMQDGELCEPSGQMGAEHFEAAMRHQLRLFAGRRLSDYLAHSCSAEAERAPVTACTNSSFATEAATNINLYISHTCTTSPSAAMFPLLQMIVYPNAPKKAHSTPKIIRALIQKDNFQS